jgi:hypothetical protein
VATVDGNGKIIIGADSSAVDETIITPHIDPKVFKKGEFGIGYCHSFRLGQIIEFWFDPPPIPEGEDNIIKYMVKDFIPELKGVLADNDYPNHDDEKTDWAIIVGVRGHLFTIESDWHVGYDDVSFAAIGAGSSYAIGAMASSTVGDNERIALNALLIAEKFCPYVIGPFNFIEV